MENYTNAILFLQKLLQLSERYQRPLDIIETRILLAIAYGKKGQGKQSLALDHLEQAVALASKYGYTQVFANEGADLVTMLHRTHKRSIQVNAPAEIDSAFAKTLYIAASLGSQQHKGLFGGRAPQNLTFTDKQKTVMRLMCHGYSRNEIAKSMNLKPYTIKSHIELIYKKLNVSTNIEAVLKIKELGILYSKHKD